MAAALKADTQFEIAVCEYIWKAYGDAVKKLAGATEKSVDKHAAWLDDIERFIEKYDVPKMQDIKGKIMPSEMQQTL